MMISSVRRLLVIAALSVSYIVSPAQPVAGQISKKEILPYKVLTSGKEITLKSSRNIQHVMLWTSGGDRVVEQRDINATSFTFTITINEKIFFLMIGLENGKVYTEKIGVQ
jgi:hypothetical protein